MGWIFKYLLPIYYSLNKVVMIQTQPNSTLKNDQNNVKRFKIIIIPLNLQNEGKNHMVEKNGKKINAFKCIQMILKKRKKSIHIPHSRHVLYLKKFLIKNVIIY